MPTEERYRERATCPIAGTDERDAEQTGLRAAAWHAATEKNPEQQKAYAYEHYLEQRESCERQRRTLMRSRSGRLRAGLSLLTACGLHDRLRLVLVLGSRARPRHAYE